MQPTWTGEEPEPNLKQDWGGKGVRRIFGLERKGSAIPVLLQFSKRSHMSHVA
ncbi:unnamed protein product [Chrysoparadoxa australica]